MKNREKYLVAAVAVLAVACVILLILRALEENVQIDGEKPVELEGKKELIAIKDKPDTQMKELNEKIDALKGIIDKFRAENEKYLEEIGSLNAELEKERQAKEELREQAKIPEEILANTGIHGYVYDVGYKPMGGGYVSVVSDLDQKYFQAWTDMKGYYKITHLTKGTYSVTSDVYPDTTIALEVKYSRMVKQDFGSKKGVRLFGYVYDENRNPIIARIKLTDPSYNFLRTNSDQNGYYEFKNIVRNKYKVNIYKGKIIKGYSVTAKPIIIPENVTEHQHDIRLSGFSISGYILDEETKEPVPGVTIYARFDVDKAHNVAFANSDTNGFYIFNNLFPGKYKTEFLPKGYEIKSVSVTLKEGENITDHNVELTPVPPLWFSLKDQYGKPIQAGISYNAKPVGSGSSIWVDQYPVKENGFLLISVLKPGKYMIGIQTEGFAPFREKIMIPEEGYPKDTPLPIVMKKLE